VIKAFWEVLLRFFCGVWVKEKMIFFEKKVPNVLWVQNKAVPLHRN
jgi:hypothetical protein